MQQSDRTAVLSPDQLAESRRTFFRDSAKLFGVASIAAAAVEAQTTAPNTAAGDIAVLNYALALEHLEAAFYNQGLRQFSSTDLRGGSFFTGFGEAGGTDAYAYLLLIRDHENAHVRTISTVIRSLGGTPAVPCTYNFGYTGVDQFLKVAAVLENTGVMAYDGAVNMISSAQIKTAAATIATVEARHASYLNLVTGAIPFPDATDTPKSMADILKAAGQFITSCAASGAA